MRVVIAGGSGMIGRHLAASLVRDGHAVEVLTRDAGRAGRRLPRGARAVTWPRGPVRELARALESSDAVVNLAGTPIGPIPWTTGRKRSIRESRIHATEALVEAIAALPAEARPRVLVNASGTDVYAGIEAYPADESAPPQADFLARVCADWEAAAQRAEEHGVRVVIVRQAFVLARDATVLALMALPFRLFVGGRLGSGRQWFSWIHVDDLVALYRWALDEANVRGIVNAASPEPCRNAEFAATAARVLHRPCWFAVPAFVLRLVLGEESTLVLASRRAVPRRVLEAAFQFRYRDLEPALVDVLR